MCFLYNNSSDESAFRWLAASRAILTRWRTDRLHDMDMKSVSSCYWSFTSSSSIDSARNN